MKIAIIQISDIHISSSRDFVISRLEYAIKSARPIINECQKAIIVITGDIANTGKTIEYDVAYDYFTRFSAGIIQENPYIDSVEYILVPGNHDCEFTEEHKVLRGALIEHVQKDDSSIDKLVANQLLEVQSNFWNFYNRLTDRGDTPFVSKQVVVNCGENIELTFHCYNTSLLSSIHEQVGSLMVPCEHFLIANEKSNDSLVISLYHHNTGWLNPSHNKKAFEKHLLDSSDIVFCGHEHERTDYVKSEVELGDNIIYYESSAYQENRQSEFAINVIDTELKKVIRHILRYHDSEDISKRFYKEIVCREYAINKRVKGMALNKTYEQSLLKLPIPIIHPIKGNLQLNDCYVFPDLEPQIGKDTDIAIYLDSAELVDDSMPEYKVLGIEGANRSGKSSLLKMLYLRFVQKGKFPLLFNGGDIADIRKLPELYKRKYKEQYNTDNRTFDFYNQLERSTRVVLIDNIERAKLNEDGLRELYKKLLIFFDKVIFTVGDRLNVTNIIATISDDENYRQYRLLSLGCVKRNVLIEKWLRLGQKPETINLRQLEDDVKTIYNTIGMILGEQFLSPYPFFLMSILQSLNKAAKTVETQQTYYAYCYKSLLISSLMSVQQDATKQRELLNFLSVTAFRIFKNNNTQHKIIHSEFEEVFSAYKEKFIFSYSSLDDCLKDILGSNIMESIDGYYIFSSKYIYYYLAAEELAKIITNDEGKKILGRLCENIYEEECSNILIFLIYHTRDTDLLEMLVLTGMYPFDEYAPITLSSEDSILKEVMSLIPTIRQKVLVQDVDPHKQRVNELTQQEKIERREEKTTHTNNSLKMLKEIEHDPQLKELLTAIHSIRILGQIVKNERSGIEKKQIEDLVNQTYQTSFRLIGFFGSDILKSQDEIVRHIIEDNNGNGRQIDNTKIRENVGKLLSFLIYKSCLVVFNNLIHAVGTKDFDDIYKKVAMQINTPAAYLVSFSIRSYYGTLNITDLEELYEQFEGNPLAQQILRARALHYVYHHTMPISDKQRIGSICGLQLVNKIDLNKGKR